MKIEMGKKYRTRDGKKVRIYAVDGVGDYCVQGAYFGSPQYGPSGWYVINWKSDGKFVEHEECYDLIEDKEDWEIAKDILETKESLHAKIGNKIYLVEEVMSHCVDSVRFVQAGTNRVVIILKSEFKLATKEEVIEYFFGDENDKG
jgi:hypothetical protein